MNSPLKTIARIAGALAFLCCFGGGAFILRKTGFNLSGEDAIWIGVGLYFIGKSFFVGPMLWLMAEKSGKAD
ncbi:MAG: hypothetical protein RL380_778 [Verrucomicrobiota bacterium]|jgi:hypothetical protein